MALSGIEIFKKLPKTNCGECGVPTCLAFAMNLAAGKAELDSCSYVDPKAKEELSEASAPPIRQISIGAGKRAFKIGGETVMFRHEKTFYNATALAAMLNADLGEEDIRKKLKEWNTIQYERVGLTLMPELIALVDSSGNKDAFINAAKIVAEESEFGLILISSDIGSLKSAVLVSAFKRPILYAATDKNIDEIGALAKEMSLPLVVKGKDLQDTAVLTENLSLQGLRILL